MRYFILIPVLIAVSAMTIACGGSGNNGGQEQQDITVSVSPETASVAGDSTQDFKATILNPNNRGVTWSLTGSGCTGSACGSIGNLGGNNNQGWTATYTAPLTVPSPATVTLTASSVDDKSKSDTASITITPPVVTVAVTPTSPTVIIGATQQFAALVRGTTNKDVTWSLSGPGSIDASGLYSTPASMQTPASVTVTATSKSDTSKSASATITIPAVSMSLTPTTARVVLGMTVQFSASVTNATNTGVTWTIGGPGSIDNSGLYMAPFTQDSDAAAQVTVTSEADPSVFRTMSFAVAVTPTISPPTATVPAGATQQFTADAPVTWEVAGVQGTDPATWGTISADGIYSAPLSPPWTGRVNVKATLQVDPRHSANSVATVVFSNASLQGHYAFRYRGNGNACLFGVGSVMADGNGAISSGSLSFYQAGTSPSSVSVAGTYSVKPDGRGSATLTFLQGGQQVQFPIHFVLTSNTSARILGFGDTGTGWGNLDLQTGLTSSSDLSGTYVFTLDGFDDTVSPVAMAGLFTAAAGTIGSGVADINNNGSVTQSIGFAGTFTPLQPYEPSTATLNVSGMLAHFIFYQLSPDVLFFISGDEDTGYLGVAIHQDTSTSFSNSSLYGNLVLVSTGYAAFDHQDAVALGRFTADGLGNLTDGVIDNILSHPTWASSVGYRMTSTATYAIQPNGRGTMTINLAGGGISLLSIYMTAPNQLLYICLNPSYSVATGQFLPQASGSYDQSLIRGSWAVNLRETYYYWPGKADVIARITSDGAGNLTGTGDVNAIIEGSSTRSLVPDSAITGTYTVDTNGRGEATLNFNGVSTDYAIYAASGRTLFMVPIDANKWASLGLGSRQF